MDQYSLIPSAPPLSDVLQVRNIVNPDWENTLRYRYKKESEKEVSDEIDSILKMHEEKMLFLHNELDKYKAEHNKKREELELKYTTLVSNIYSLMPNEPRNSEKEIQEKVDLYLLLKDEKDKDQIVIDMICNYERKIAKLENFLLDVEK